MRIVVLLLTVASIAGAILKFTAREEPAAAESPAKAPVAPQSASREPSKHNWPKRALDRAAEVKRQVAEERKEDGTR